MVDIVLSMRLQTPSAPTVHAPTSPLGSLCSVQCLAVYICICIGQVLAMPLKRQLYQAPVSKHFVASAIVSRFGVCLWDGSPVGLSSGCPFFQSLLHSLSLDFFRQEQFWIKILEMGGWPHPSTGGPCLTSGYGLDRFSLPFVGISANVIPVGSWKALAFLASGTLWLLPPVPHPPLLVGRQA